METLARIVPYLLYLAMFGVLAALAVGVISMLRGGPFNAKYSNKLMRARVGFQALALALFALLLLLSKYAGPPGGPTH
jgi:hypothetical protein